AVALAGHFGFPIRQQLDIASQHDLDRAIHSAVALRQCGFGLFGDFSDSLTPGFSSGILESRVGDVIPRKLCYHSHCSIPLSEGLTVGHVILVCRPWVTCPCCFYALSSRLALALLGSSPCSLLSCLPASGFLGAGWVADVCISYDVESIRRCIHTSQGENTI